MAVSNDQMRIGIVLGRILIKDEQEITDIVIYTKKTNSPHEKFEFKKQRQFNFINTCI